MMAILVIFLVLILCVCGVYARAPIILFFVFVSARVLVYFQVP
jgi:hypothetical protein